MVPSVDFQPCPERRVGNTCSFGPLGDSQRFAVDGEEFIPSAVVCLDALRCPSDVSGFVVPVVVDSVNGMLRRGSRANVFPEHEEVLAPFWGDRYSTPSVVVEERVFGVVASLEQIGPNLPLWTFTESVLGSIGAGGFDGVATTRLRVTTSQAPDEDKGDVPAIASALDAAVLASVFWAVSDYKKSSESLSGQVYSVGHH